MSLFTVRQKKEVVVVKCPAEMGGAAVEELSKLTAEWLRSPAKLYVLDMTSCSDLQQAIYRPLVLFYQELKKQAAFLCSINLPEKIAQQVHDTGLDSVFSPQPSLDDALKVAGITVQRPVLDVNFINPFIKATQTTLDIQANVQINVGKPSLKKEDVIPGVDIAGVISLSSKVFHGSIALCFPSKVFLAIYSSMVGGKHDAITKDIEDAAGELLNMIFGQAKAELNMQEDYQIQKAIPTIVRGNDLKVHHMSRRTAIILPFETNVGAFHLEISIDAV